MKNTLLDQDKTPNKQKSAPSHARMLILCVKTTYSFMFYAWARQQRYELLPAVSVGMQVNLLVTIRTMPYPQFIDFLTFFEFSLIHLLTDTFVYSAINRLWRK